MSERDDLGFHKVKMYQSAEYHITGGPIALVVQHVEIDEGEALALFSRGREIVGRWHKIWEDVKPENLKRTLAAVRYYYGWRNGGNGKGSEKIRKCPDGTYSIESKWGG